MDKIILKFTETGIKIAKIKGIKIAKIILKKKKE